MTTIAFNDKLDELMAQAVEYFRTHYISKYREHSQMMQSQDFNGDPIGNVHIYSHIDTDGLCSASILSLALKRENISYHITILKQLEEKYMEDIVSSIQENQEFLFFLDFGSGQLNLLSEYLPKEKFIILDHHQPLKSKNPPEITGFHVNPYSVGIDGSSEISGSGMTYLFAKKLRKDNIDLSSLAVIGAIGDHQNTGDQQTFMGENLAILQDAIKSNQIVKDVEPNFPRTVSLPLGLANFLPEELNLFEGNIEKSTYFLNKIGINYEDQMGHPRFFRDLSTNEKTKLISSLVQMVITVQKDNKEYLSKLLTTHYLIAQLSQYPEIYDASDFSTMINACGRLNVPTIGITCCVSRSNQIIMQGIEFAKQYTKKLQDGIKWLIKGNKFTHLKAIEAFDGENIVSELIIGVICTILIDSPEYDNSSAFNNSRPILGYAKSDDSHYKISARCTEDMIDKGVDLSKAIRKASSNLGLKNKGGGHPPAAGALVPTNLIRQFLSQVDEQVQNQLGIKKESKSASTKKTMKKQGEKKDGTVKKSKSPKKTMKHTKKKTTTKPDTSQESPSKKKKTKGLDQFFG